MTLKRLKNQNKSFKFSYNKNTIRPKLFFSHTRFDPSLKQKTKCPLNFTLTKTFPNKIVVFNQIRDN